MISLFSGFGRKLRLAALEVGQHGFPIEAVSPPEELAGLSAYSRASGRGLQTLYELSQDVMRRQIPGDLVECGVGDGGSAGAIAYAIRHTGRTLWLYDTWVDRAECSPSDHSCAHRPGGEWVGSMETIQAALAITQLPEENYILREGGFHETFHPPLPQPIALLHIDVDWYSRVMLCLTTFYNRVTEGGVIILDGFGECEGCREAFYDFAQQQQIKPLLERVGHSRVFWVKGRSHNRSLAGQWNIP